MIDAAPEKTAEKPSENVPEDDVVQSSAPIMEHIKELRNRLLKSLAALMVMFIICFFFANEIFNILLQPLGWATGEEPRLIYTAPQEYFFTQLKIAMFGGFFLAFPVIAVQIYAFVAPGLYKNERSAFRPYLIATPALFTLGALLLYFIVLPLALRFFVGMQQVGPDVANIELLPRVSDYLSFVMTLILAFGICFQLPVILTLLAQIGTVNSEGLKRWRRYAIVAAFAAAAVLTPPDLVSQIGLALPTLLLYEVAILAVKVVEKRRLAREAKEAAEES
jgi:sec-independent protein translocase protein TatC